MITQNFNLHGRFPMTIETIQASHTNSTALRVKRKNLADESRTIKLEERRAKEAGETGYLSPHDLLYRHRIDVVRPAARTNHLAHAFLTGRPYHEVEHSCGAGNRPDWASVRRTAFRFGKLAGLDEAALETRWQEWSRVAILGVAPSAAA